MKPNVILYRAIIISFLACLVSTGLPQTARASVFDNALSIIEETHLFPTTQLTLFSQSKAFVECLVDAGGNDLKVIACVDQFNDTPSGSAVIEQGGIPDWFFTLLDLYVCVSNDDIWCALSKLGETVFCILAQVMAEGYDVCGLIKELAELGETLLDAASAVGEFLADAGETIADAASAALCTVGIGDCGKSSPPEVLVYQWVFAPKVRDAVEAKKLVDPSAYTTLFNLLKNNASHNTAIYSVPSKNYGGITFPPAVAFSSAAVAISAGSFDKAVDANWTSSVVNTALGELSTQRHAYNNPNQLRFLVNSATTDFETLQRSNPNLRIDQKLPGLIIDRCTKEFSETRKFAHVDRWISSHPAQTAQLGNPKTNRDWCNQLWDQNKQSFTPALRQYAAEHFCQGMSCTTLTKYQSCVALMSLVGQQATCTPTNQVGREAATTIRTDLLNQRSQLPCSIRNDSKGISPATVDLVCSRPPLGSACTATYKRLFTTLPVRLVNCIVEERPDYTAQKNSFYATVKALQLSKRFAINLDQIDPLVAHIDASKEDLMAALQLPGTDPGAGRGEATRITQNLRYEYQYNATIDGENSPLYIRARGAANQLSSQQSGNAQQATHTPVGGYHSPAQTGGSKVGTGLDRQGGFTNPGNPYMQQQSSIGKTAGQAARHGGVASQQAQARTMTPPVSGKPDLMVVPQVRIGNSAAQWGSTINLTNQQVQSAGNGFCSTTITYMVKNNGSAEAPAFSSTLLSSSATNRPLPQQWNAIAQGTSLSKTEQVLLRTGQNSLTLQINQVGQVDELNKANNQASLQIILSGVCQPIYQQQQQPVQRQLPQRQMKTTVPSRQPGLF